MEKAIRYPVKGQILLSEPNLEDDIFKRSVILLAEDSDQGSMGFILNKPVGYRIHEVINDFPEFDSAVFLGGPVDNQSLFFIHTVPQLIGSSFEIAGGIHFGGDFNKLKELISIALIEPEQIRFFAGYSGWDSGQLRHELESEAWMIFDRPDTLLQMKSEELWGSLLRTTRTEKAIWSNYPENPELN